MIFLFYLPLSITLAEFACLKSGVESIQGQNIGQNFLIRSSRPSQSNCKTNKPRPEKFYAFEKDVFIADETAIYYVTECGALSNEHVSKILIRFAIFCQIFKKYG